MQTQSNSLLNSITNQWIQIVSQPQIKLTHIKSNHYFLLINKKYNQALSYVANKKYTEQHAIMADPNETDIQQIFLIQQIQDQKYQIVHGISTLVFTDQEEEVKLNFGKWKNNQFFYPEKVNNNSQKLEYWIKSSKSSSKYLYYDGFALRCGKKSPFDQQTVWQIRLCLHNKRLNRSCWLQYAYSNQVIDIPQATEKKNVNLIQYPCNYRFNQRFYLIKEENQDVYLIQSLKTELYLTVSSGAFSKTIVQDRLLQQDKRYKQLWKIEYIGNGLYTIKSSKDGKFLVVKDRSTKLQEILVLNDEENWCVWKIIGNFNIMPNKDLRF